MDTAPSLIPSWPLLLVAGVASPVGRGGWYWAILGGYWSHLWLDMLNIRGIDLFWPSTVRVGLPGYPAYRLDVGGKAEMVLMIAPGREPGALPPGHLER